MLGWYKAYCGLLTLTYVLTAVFGFWVIVTRYSGASGHSSEDGLLVGGVMAACGLLFGGACGAALVLPARPWAWTYHLAIICLGLSSVCCLPICIPLLIFWLKPETKAYFGRS